MSQGNQKRKAALQFKSIPLKRNKSNSSARSSQQFLKSESPTQYKQCAKIIVGFPGIGKSLMSKDSSDELKWLNIQDEPGYAKGAEDSFKKGVLILAQKPGVLLLPAHRMVGEFLVQNRLAFTSIFPKRCLKSEYLRRYRDRGSSTSFVELVDSKWDLFVKNMWYPGGRCNHIELNEGQFLKDVLLRVLTQTDAE